MFIITEKEKIETLEATARIYMALANSLKKDNIDSWKFYARKGIKCCKMAMELQNVLDEDPTQEFLMVA